MKKFLKIFGIVILVILVILYLVFLFVLPRVVDLNQYKPMLKQIVKEQAHLDIDFGDVKIITTPLLSAGIKTDNIKIKYEDGSELISADGLKARIALPSLLLYTIKLSCLEIENPDIELTVDDGKNLKILQHADKIIAEQQKKKMEEPAVEQANNSAFDVSKIRIKIPDAKFKNYNIKALDLKNKHNLVLKGEELKLGYFNGKTARLKTNAVLKSDDETKITANIDIDTFLPAPNKLDEEDDRVERAEMPYANLVEIYRTYDLAVNADAKLKIREKNGKYKLNGYTNIDDLTLKLSNYNLPKSYAHFKFNGEKAYIDTDLKLDETQSLKVKGLVDYDKNPKADLSIDTDVIYLKSLMNFAKGITDTLHIRNNLASIKTEGFFTAKTKFKTDFKKLKSEGHISLRNGQFSNPKTGLNITKANGDIILDNDTLNIKDAEIYVDGTPLTMEGSVNEKSVADINVKTEKLPLKGFYNTFAPDSLKSSYLFNSGNISLDINLVGELKNAVMNVEGSLNNFAMSDKARTMIISNEKVNLYGAVSQKDLKANLSNKNLLISLPQTKSVIKNPNLDINIDKDIINLVPSKLFINGNSSIDYQATVTNWQNQKKSVVDFKSEGKLNSQDIKQFAGKDLAMFIDAKGVIPVKATFSGEGKRQNLILQILADKNNYITPVNIASLYNKDSILQTVIAFKGDHLKIKDTGLFERSYSVDPETNETKTTLKEILGVEGTIANLKFEPFINLLTIRIPEDLAIAINGFKRADFILGGKLFVYGKTSAPRYNGDIYINDLKIDDLLTSVDKTDMKFSDRKLNVNVDNILLNGSDVNIGLKTNLIPSDIFTIEELNLASKNIDVDTALKVVEALDKFMPKSSAKSSKTSKPADIPVELKNGTVDINRLKTGNIIVDNIVSRLNLSRNILYLNNLTANAFRGDLSGNISMNLISGILHIQMGGKGINSEKLLLDTANLKDTLTGTLEFDSDLTMNAASSDFEAQMKSIDGIVNFTIQNGQLGPFGKIENMILAENIRESAFFQTALGGIISNLTTIDTTHFANMTGHVILKDAIVDIAPVTTNGNVLNLYLTGNMDILKNTLDMKVRIKLGSAISNMLGPIAALNPINLVKATPGLNVAMAKAFTLFSEEISLDEMNAIPKFKDKNAEDYATRVQIVLRGDVAKPLSLIKSFKWLVTSTEMAAAESFVSSLPEPVVTDDGQVLVTAEEINAYNEYNNKRSTKIKKAIKHIFTRKEKEKSVELQETEPEIPDEGI